MIDDRLDGMENQSIHVHDTLQSFINDGTSEAVRARYEMLPSAAARADYGVLDRNIVVVDTEATGLSSNHDELTQIAAARMDKGEIVEWFITFVNPGKAIPEDIARLTDIHDEDVAEAPSPSDALAELVEFVGDATIVAHNVGFDKTFTTKHPGGYPLIENTWIDSLDLARIALPRLRSHRLLDLVRAFGAPLSTHRADADVAATCAIFRILLAAVDAMSPALVREIAGMATPDQWSTQVVFDYFARRKSGDATSAMKEPTTQETFSLSTLRRRRTEKTELRARADADEIAADPYRDLVFPTAEDMEEAFSPSGLVGSLYRNFEVRSEQLDMAEAVLDSFSRSENLIVEAGTGVGKSMAYLVPAALVARANGIAVGVATKTNALLDQLVFHELPALAKALESVDGAVPGDRPLTFAPLKGFSHYPCLHKIDRVVSNGAQTKLVAGREQSQAPALAALLSFIEQTEYDDIDSLKLDYRVLPRYAITTASNECLRRKCPYYGTACFVHGSRRRAEAADIVITNHSLLFCDLVADGGLLPPIRYWVLDEAHGAESEARRAFSLTLSAEDIIRLATRVSDTETSRSVFARATRHAVTAPDEDEGAELLYALVNKARAAGRTYAEHARIFVAHMKDLLFFDSSKRGRGYETVELWINDDIRSSQTFSALVSYGNAMTDAAEKLVTTCQELVGYLEGIDGVAEVQREIAATAIELKEQLHAAEIILDKAPDGYAYAATLCRKNDRTAEKIEALLINVGETMNQTLFARTHSVVFASATLSVDGEFDAFENALGLNTSEFSPSRMRRLDSSYDFDNQMTIYVVNDIMEPNGSSYLAQLQDLLIDTHRAQRGSMLTLFTNRREMEKCFEVVQPALKEDGLRLVCQKWGLSIKGLRDDFLADEHLSLFALRSFWEGFDAPGATLRGVIIPKLPFSKPTDPLSCERSARDDQAWKHYVLPQAVLEVKQAAGRLIRKADDRGVLILADRRLLTKGYGKAFLNSLPSKTIRVLSTAEITAELLRSRS